MNVMNSAKPTNPQILPFVLDYYDKEVINMIRDKYGLDEWSALRRFLHSETYAMLSDSSLEMWDFGYPAIFDMWETEQVTGDPRNSVYIRGE
jgi:hypothetical protein